MGWMERNFRTGVVSLLKPWRFCTKKAGPVGSEGGAAVGYGARGGGAGGRGRGGGGGGGGGRGEEGGGEERRGEERRKEGGERN